VSRALASAAPVSWLKWPLNGTDVSRNPHDGWTIYDGNAKYSSRRSPEDCLRWWVDCQAR
jgi:hypothetical protein